MIDLTFNGKDLTFNGKNLVYSDGPVDPYNPYNLPLGTIRYRFGDPSYDPNTTNVGGLWVQVSSSPNIWDWSLTPANPSLVGRFSTAFNGIGTVDILGANLNGLDQPDLYRTWESSGITSVAILDTREVLHFSEAFTRCTSLQFVADGIPISGDCFQMFYGCFSLRRVPLLQQAGAVNLSEMFENCYNVEGGILDFYDRFRYITEQGAHWACFRNCGINTTTGAAELAQIPDTWK